MAKSADKTHVPGGAASRLAEYQRKRDFTKSPEPSGERRPSRQPAQRKARKGAFFCVQKHLASHLHYDFRLEHDGVLLSWAVPKGPSLDPSVKRLAMQVEDHPRAYGTFEGVIPEGYGAGIVMLWDEGTWTPEVDDVDAALAKGDLKFSLDGYKLKGSWALVRTRGYGGSRGDGRSWLLIKHRDEWSGDVDIADVRAAQREEQPGLSRDSRRGQSRDLADEPAGVGRRNRRDASRDHRESRGAEGVHAESARQAKADEGAARTAGNPRARHRRRRTAAAKKPARRSASRARRPLSVPAAADRRARSTRPIAGGCDRDGRSDCARTRLR